MPSLSRTKKRVSTNIRRGVRLSAVVLLPCAASLVLIRYLNPEASFDVVVTEAAVPLVVCYILVRMIALLASGAAKITEEERAELEVDIRERHALHEVRGVLAFAFALGMWIGTIGVISALVYWSLGLAEAVDASMVVIKWILYVAAGSAMGLCLLKFCRRWILVVAKLSRDMFDHPFQPGPTRYSGN
jgi:hypothetical protein